MARGLVLLFSLFLLEFLFSVRVRAGSSGDCYLVDNCGDCQKLKDCGWCSLEGQEICASKKDSLCATYLDVCPPIRNMITRARRQTSCSPTSCFQDDTSCSLCVISSVDYFCFLPESTSGYTSSSCDGTTYPGAADNAMYFTPSAGGNFGFSQKQRGSRNIPSLQDFTNLALLPLVNSQLSYTPVLNQSDLFFLKYNYIPPSTASTQFGFYRPNTPGLNSAVTALLMDVEANPQNYPEASFTISDLTIYPPAVLATSTSSSSTEGVFSGSNSTYSKSSNNSGGLSGGAIAGIVIGSIVFVAFIVVAIVLLLVYSKK